MYFDDLEKITGNVTFIACVILFFVFGGYFLEGENPPWYSWVTTFILSVIAGVAIGQLVFWGAIFIERITEGPGSFAFRVGLNMWTDKKLDKQIHKAYDRGDKEKAHELEEQQSKAVDLWMHAINPSHPHPRDRDKIKQKQRENEHKKKEEERENRKIRQEVVDDIRRHGLE